MARSAPLLLAAALLLPAPCARAASSFIVKHDTSQPTAACYIEDIPPGGGHQTGACDTLAGGLDAVVFDGGVHYLGATPTAIGFGTAAAGEVVGVARLAPPATPFGFFWNGSLSTLPAYNGCPVWPVDISGDGTRVVGGAIEAFCALPNGGSFLREGGGYVSVHPDARTAFGISWDGRTIVGGTPAFRWDDGTVTSLDVPVPSQNVRATAVSSEGSLAVGTYDDPNLPVGTDGRQVLWGPNGFTELGASEAWPTATTPPDENGMPIVVVGGPGVLQGVPGETPTIWTGPFGLESLQTRLGAIVPPGWILRSATGLTDDGRRVVGTVQWGAADTDVAGYLAYMPQWRTVTIAYFGDLDIDGYVVLQQPDDDPPARVAARVEFFGTTGGTFASDTTAAPVNDPYPLFEALGVGQANLVYATDPLLVWTLAYDGGLDAPVEFTTQYPSNTILPPEEITLLQWDDATSGWVERQRLAIDVAPEVREVTVEIPTDAFVPGQPIHLAVGRTLADCADGADNDEDGLIDWNGGDGFAPDPGCKSAIDPSEEPSRCALGPELVLLLPILIAWHRRRAGD